MALFETPRAVVDALVKATEAVTAEAGQAVADEMGGIVDRLMGSNVGRFVGPWADRVGTTAQQAFGTLGEVERTSTGGGNTLSGGDVVIRIYWLLDVTLFALERLRDLSPVASGSYQRSFFVIADGRYLPPEIVNATEALTEAMRDVRSEVIIGNTQPYNRRVELQNIDGRLLRFSVAPNLYEVAAQQTETAFDHIVTFESLPDVPDFSGRYIDRKSHGQGFTSPGLRLTQIGV